jgi:hypothetical protein
MADSVTPTPRKTYHVWLIAHKEAFAEALVAKLIRRGFTIGPLGRQLITSHENNMACVIAMSVFRIARNEAERKEYNAMGVHNEVVDVIKQIKGKFWGIVVSAAEDSTWNMGNCNIEDEQKERFEAAKKVN